MCMDVWVGTGERKRIDCESKSLAVLLLLAKAI